MLVAVTNKYNNTYKYRRRLYRLGLRYANGKWQTTTSDDRLIKKIAKYCRKHNLYCECIPENYVRSGTYRREFLGSYKKYRGRYFRCAYCGKMLVSKEMTVDHIIPVDKAQHSKSVRRLMKFSGISNVNDIRNLTPACRKCNKRKSASVNLRCYARGMAGRTYAGATFVHYTVSAVLCAIICACMLAFYFGVVFFTRR